MGRYSFRKVDRLLSKDDFKRVFEAGCVLRSRDLMVRVRTNGLEYPRLGLVVGKRYSRKAVIRNRAKRLLREAFRLNRDRLPRADLVVMPSPRVRLDSLQAAVRALLHVIDKGRTGPARDDPREKRNSHETQNS